MGVIGQYARTRADITKEEAMLIVQYGDALRGLAIEEPKYAANFRAYGRWTNAQCLAWIYWIEEQAEKDPPLPMAHAVVARVITNKLTS